MGDDPLLLGLDIGTTSTKAVMIDRRGRLIFAASCPHPISRPHEGWSEQNPTDWWASTRGAVIAAREAAGGRKIAAIGLSVGVLAPMGYFLAPYLLDIVQKMLFDTVYHEHLCYHSVRSLDLFFSRHGLQLVEMQRIPTL